MSRTSAYFRGVLKDIQQLDERIRLLECHFAGQRAFVRSKYHAELESIHSQFTSLVSLIKHMGEGRELLIPEQQVDLALRNLVLTVDALIADLQRQTVPIPLKPSVENALGMTATRQPS